MKFADVVGEPKQGDAIEIMENDRSYDNGRTWRTEKIFRPIERAYCSTRAENGPSIGGGFWGNANEIRSGYSVSYCSRFDGKRWRSLRTS